MHLIKQQIEYNLWANTRIAAVLEKCKSELLDAELKSSFPSVRKTVHHIWDAELIWLARLENKKLAWPPTAQFVDPGITDFLNASRALFDLVNSKNEEYFSSSTSFSDSKGNPFMMNNAGIIMHVANHSTFHRGQIITMLRELGLSEFPPTDLIKFLRDKAK